MNRIKKKIIIFIILKLTEILFFFGYLVFLWAVFCFSSWLKEYGNPIIYFILNLIMGLLGGWLIYLLLREWIHNNWHKAEDILSEIEAIELLKERIIGKWH